MNDSYLIEKSGDWQDKVVDLPMEWVCDIDPDFVLVRQGGWDGGDDMYEDLAFHGLYTGQ